MSENTMRFVVFHGISITSKLIAFFTRSCYTHVAFQHPNGQLIETWAHNGGVKSWWDWSSCDVHTPGTKYEVWELPVPPGCLEWCVKEFETMANTNAKYDYWGVLGFVIRRVKERKNRWFCSEGCWDPLARWYGISGVAQPHKVSPDIFVSLLAAMGGRMTACSQC